MTVSAKQNDKDYVFYLFKEVIPNAQVVRDLRLLFDCKLLFNQHGLITANELSRMVNFIFGKFKTRNTAFLAELCKCLLLLPSLIWLLQPVLFSPCFSEYQSCRKRAKVFKKRLRGLKLSHLSYSDRSELFSSESSMRRRIILDLVLTCKLTYGLWSDL